jgi:hypothetical protein
MHLHEGASDVMPDARPDRHIRPVRTMGVGAQGRDRTTDTVIFSLIPALKQGAS